VVNLADKTCSGINALRKAVRDAAVAVAFSSSVALSATEATDV
jgi:hypothetical protein